MNSILKTLRSLTQKQCPKCGGWMYKQDGLWNCINCGKVVR